MVIRKYKIKLAIFSLSLATTITFADTNNGFGIAGENLQPSSTASSTLLKVPAQTASITNLIRSSNSVFVGKTQTQVSQQNQQAQPPSSVTQPSSSDQTLGGTGVSQQAFANMVRNMMPLSPTQIRTLRYLFNRSQRAAAEYPGVPPRPTITSVNVNLAPGATPPIIRLREGYVTPLVFVDSTGAPWPIQAIDMGNPEAFSVEWNGKGNTVVVQAKDAYESGDMVVFLKGDDTPIVLSLMPGQQAVDYRVDLRVPGLGPNAKPAISGLPSPASNKLMTFLNGIPAHGSQALKVIGGGMNTEAWLYQKHLILRSSYTVLSPGWIASMSSPDGTHVYELPKTPLILASYLGQIVQLSVKGL